MKYRRKVSFEGELLIIHPYLLFCVDMTALKTNPQNQGMHTACMW